MMRTPTAFLSAVFAAALLLVSAPSALAANSNVVVTGSVLSELSLSVPVPAVMSLSHATPGTSTSAVAVVSTQPSWTMTIRDQNTGTGAGRLKQTLGSAFLTNPLEWNVNGGAYQALTGTAATVTTGSLIQTKTVGFRQSLTTDDLVNFGDAYQLTAVISVN